VEFIRVGTLAEVPEAEMRALFERIAATA